MRMWMLPPEMLCRKHLLGEHVECHMLLGCLQKGKSIQGFIDKGLVEVHHLEERHLRLASEMVSRGYNHNSPFPPMEELEPLLYRAGKVDVARSAEELSRRCKDCAKLIDLVMADRHWSQDDLTQIVQLQGHVYDRARAYNRKLAAKDDG